jgi:hypothetical protein
MIVGEEDDRNNLTAWRLERSQYEQVIGRPRTWSWIAAFVCAALFARVLAMARDRQPLVLDANASHRLPGKFIALSHGYTGYDVTGPADGRGVLLVPAISVARTVFARTAASLEAGNEAEE